VLYNLRCSPPWRCAIHTVVGLFHHVLDSGCRSNRLRDQKESIGKNARMMVLFVGLGARVEYY